MPPTGHSLPSTPGTISTNGAEPYYSNEDVAVLHDIVTLAQEILPAEILPTNALFSAYYSVLARFQVNPDHDNRYARILFKIGGLRGSESLYRKFERILSRMGIEIEFGLEDDDEGSSAAEDFTRGRVELSPDSYTEDQGDHAPPRQRRKSESSTWGVVPQLRDVSIQRCNSFSMVSNTKRTTLQDSEFPMEMAARRFQRSRTNTNFVDNASSGGDIGAWLALGHSELPQRRERSISIHNGLHIRRTSSSLGREEPATAASGSTSDDFLRTYRSTATTSRLDKNASGNSYDSYPPCGDRPASQRLLETNDSLNMIACLRSFAQHFLSQWKDKAQQILQRNVNLESVAIDHDHKVLAQSALVTWRLLLLDKSQAVETERFFAHLERRAIRARQLYLLHIAFTHWSVCAEEQVQRTALARRHIVRVRIFDAWRDITTINELKTRRYVIRKFFYVWKQCFNTITTNHCSAVMRYEEDLAKRSFQSWITKILTAKALTWKIDRTRSQRLYRWIMVSHKYWKDEHKASVVRHRYLIAKALQVWCLRSAEQVARDRQALLHGCGISLQHILRKWCQESGVLPAKVVLQTQIARRQLRCCFHLWSLQFQQQQQASRLDRVKVLREGWINWRYKARSRLITTRIDNRFIAQAIYRWLIAARASMTSRSRSQSLKSEVLENCMLRCQAVRTLHSYQHYTAEASLIRKTQIHALRYWYHSMGSLQRLETMVGEFSSTHRSRSFLSHWTRQSQHLQEMNKWSQHAAFYFLTSRTLKQWKQFAESARREKRKAAFGQIRRLAKINLVKVVLQSWHQRLSQVLTGQARATEMQLKRDVVIGIAIFQRWFLRSEQVSETHSSCRTHVTEKYFQFWRNHLIAIQALRDEAIFSYAERRKRRILKRWHLMVLQLKAHKNYAADICEKNAKRTFRRIFSYWRQSTVIGGMPKVRTPPALRSITKPEGLFVIRGGTHGGNGLKGKDGPIVLKAIPGYLSTPSKRSERIMAAASRFTTTPMAPLSTPFERHLRAQWAAGPISFRDFGPGPGRGPMALMDGEFMDLPEQSTNDP